jgi:hypothetical protein
MPNSLTENRITRLITYLEDRVLTEAARQRAVAHEVRLLLRALQDEPPSERLKVLTFLHRLGLEELIAEHQ